MVRSMDDMHLESKPDHARRRGFIQWPSGAIISQLNQSTRRNPGVAYHAGNNQASSRMDLYLLRHAIAVERGTAGFDDDRSRPLTDEGRGKMERAAKGMRALGLKVDVILSGPYVRARETAEIAAAELGLKKRLKLEPLLAADREPAKMLTLLADTGWREKSVMLVGHEPFLSELASLLIQAGGGSALQLKKGGLCKLTVLQLRPKPGAQLDWLLTPGQLRLLASARPEK
jgi:phosphohistidine phosphatase